MIEKFNLNHISNPLLFNALLSYISEGPKNCKVGEWGPWSKCSKSCGIGEQTRSRKVIRHPKRNGKSCPELEMVRWCGSARNECRGKYFDW